jgi:hypothetical protein
MASDVGICNMALSHIGDAGLITAISPPDGSVQAALCSRFYAHSVRTAIEARDWSFALRRVALADLANPTGPWLYRYALPESCARVSKILPPEASTREEATHAFTLETSASGAVTILTDVPQASALYVRYITDTAKFTEHFTGAVTWMLASLLAGPLIKGKAGAQVGEASYSRYLATLSVAAALDASQHKPRSRPKPGAVKARA